MSINQAYLLKGWLLGEHPPAQIMEAIDAVIAGLAAPLAKTELTLKGLDERGNPVEEVFRVETVPKAEVTEVSAPIEQKKPRQWSPDARAAAAERMRVRQAAGLMKKKEPEEPGEAEALSPR